MNFLHACGRARPLLVVCLVLFPGMAPAQTSRAEAIAAEQAAKAEQLGEEGPTRAEETVARVSGALMGGPPTGAYPWFGSVFEGAGTAIGIGYRRPFGGQAAVNTVAGWSVRQSTLLEVRADLPRLADGRIATALTARRVDAKDVAYYGLGPGSTEAARERYDFQPTTVGLEVTARPVQPLVLSAAYEHLAIDTSGAALEGLAAADAPGFGESLRYGVTRVAAGLDWRPAEGYSTRGGFVRASWTRHHERAGRAFGFDTREVETAHMVPLVREHYVLAFRALATFTAPRDGSRVPFMLTPYLGSGSTLRGFRNRRFADGHRLLLTGEYRWRPSRYLDMALFVDAGQVAGQSDAFRRDAMQTAFGLGGRFHGPTFSALRIDVARGREGWTLALSTAQPF